MANRTSFCWNCWRDWKNEFLSLSPGEQEQFLEANPRINPNDYDRGKCPFCGNHYDDELETWFAALMSDDDMNISDEVGGYDKADWEGD